MEACHAKSQAFTVDGPNVQGWLSLLHSGVGSVIVLSVHRFLTGTSLRFMANVPAAVVISLKLNPVMDIMFNIPAAITSTVGGFHSDIARIRS